MVDQFLAKGFTLISVGNCLFDTHTSEAVGLDHTANTFRVEICIMQKKGGVNFSNAAWTKVWFLELTLHDVLESFVDLSNNMRFGYLDIFKCDVSSSRGPDTRTVHLTGSNTRHAALNQQEGDPTKARLTSAHSHTKEVSED